MELLNELNSTPSSSTIGKGKKTLSQAIASGKLSAQDIAYIKVATDPWHDTKIDNFQGIPDNYVGKSVTEVITQTMDVSTPYGAGSGNYHVRLSSLPILGQDGVVRGSCYNGNVAQEALVPSPPNYTLLSSCNVDFSQTGGFADYNSSAISKHMTLPDSVLNGSVKVAGLGIEVVNTTAELNKQGLVSVARVPQPMSRNIKSAYIYGNAGGTANAGTVLDLIPVVSMPTTLAELTTYPDYDQWEAKEGLYSVVRQYDPESFSPIGWNGVMRFIDDEPVGVGFSGAGIVYKVNADTSALLWATSATTGFPTNAYAPDGCFINCPQDSLCAMFTGLSEQTTLTIKFKWYIERRVNTSISAVAVLVPFVKDSPGNNPLATELVNRIWSELPCAVMFKENPAGEWWNRIMAAIGEYGPSILGMIPHPLAQAAAKALPMATKALSSKNNQNAEIDNLQKEVARMRARMQQQNQSLDRNRSLSIKQAQPKKKKIVVKGQAEKATKSKL